MIKKILKKIKKIKFHPIITYVFLSILIMIICFILNLFDFQSTYTVINSVSLSLEQISVSVRNVLNFNGIKEIISNATVNFISFSPLSMFLVASLSLCVCEASGFLDTIFRKMFSKLNIRFVTFIIIYFATISTLINEIGFVILIPLAAIIFKSKGKNPLIGVCAAFAGVAFGAGTTLFVGSTEVSLIPLTTIAARMIDANYHVSLLSNIYIMNATSIILSIVGTFIIEHVVTNKVMKYKQKRNLEISNDLELISDDAIEYEQTVLSNNYKEERGLKYALIFGGIYFLFFVYSLIPNLPFSGLLLDMNEDTYLKQIFGNNSYFQDGFTYMISIFFLITGLAYGIGSKKFKSDKDIVEESSKYLQDIGSMLLLLFVASQFVAIYKMTNIGTVLTSIMVNFLSGISFGGIPFLIISFIMIGLSNILLTGVQAKWMMFSPIVVATLMKSNITPQFAQFLMRGATSITNGITPIYAFFVIFVGYLNVYNNDKSKPITLFESVRLMVPYCIIIAITWLFIILGWYILGLPIGPSVLPTL